MVIHIYDGMNYCRTRIEDHGETARDLYEAARAKIAGMTKIWVWEGKGGNERRRKVYPDYKKNRTARKGYENIFETVNMIRQLLFCTDSYQIDIPTYEGDDVLAALVKIYRGRDKLVIMSNDKDFRQLYGEDVVGFASPLLDKDKQPLPDGVTRLYKTLVGDPADSISGIPGFGAVKFHALHSWSQIETRFSHGNFTIYEEDGFLPKHVEWANSNKHLLKIMWEITGFYDIPYDVIAQHCKQGQANDGYAQSILGKYLLKH